MLVAVLASQSNFSGMAAAPLFVLCGLLALVIHIALLALAARTFRFDLSAVRHLLAGADRRRRLGARARRDVLADPGADRGAAGACSALILGTGIGLAHGERAVGAGAGSETDRSYAIAVASSGCSQRAPRAPRDAADSCTRRSSASTTSISIRVLDRRARDARGARARSRCDRGAEREAAAARHVRARCRSDPAHAVAATM